MAHGVLFLEGFDGLRDGAGDTTVWARGKWASLVEATISTTNGRAGGYGMAFSGYAGDSGSVIVPGTHGTLICGIALNTPSYSTSLCLPTFLDGAGNTQVRITFDGAGHFQAYRNFSGQTLLGTSSNVYPLNEWHYVETKVVFRYAATGSVEVRVDGLTWLSIPTVQTSITSGHDYANGFRIGAASSGIGPNGIKHDDIYLSDGTNGFLGDIRVFAVHPDGDSAVQFSRSTGATNYGCVDETVLNDADYVYSSTVGNKDLYTMQDIAPSTGTIFAVQFCPRMKKDDAGSKTACGAVKVGSTEVDLTSVALGDTFSTTPTLREVQPDGTTDWDVASINSMLCGIKVVS